MVASYLRVLWAPLDTEAPSVADSAFESSPSGLVQMLADEALEHASTDPHAPAVVATAAQLYDSDGRDLLAWVGAASGRASGTEAKRAKVLSFELLVRLRCYYCSYCCCCCCAYYAILLPPTYDYY